ncbi:MAG: hypothetical protein A2Y28_02990 [Chlamydiae bacterium GWC2_50_10]|nr:MAG: hypothetical protein A2Z85_02650 [Chlamydiae bacterium GWA2_50_15]OGN54212.1 MAG: hypothetical protein A2Y28_02990 [Chlamydiae bacterium GWC2_50_10]OGN55008.1 MAG: hypothetical protein A2098_00005 [Chlamydiae bacterium GWF2_49_8]OGN58168.1 MAG: hypothetical protein A3D18_06000 [Chlamydiae bacterium RIFCSPHIGHO2_02_FULL_49_29]OGN62415.1 MAG: hypothetical protein A3E26_05180 [Chlamydiae bacterium RIFCSPHIGHO2_12_FULL_49_32]OGN67949.1 MAG: hypothetical protein A3I15_06335 [Chlamydiae bact
MVSASFLINLPKGSVSHRYFELVEQAGKAEWFSAITIQNPLVKKISSILVTYAVFPYFALVGAFWNSSMAALKGGMGLARHFFPDVTWLKEVKPEEARMAVFQHLGYVGIDTFGRLFSIFVVGAFAFAPQDVTQLYRQADEEIRSGNAYNKFILLIKFLSSTREEATA